MVFASNAEEEEQMVAITDRLPTCRSWMMLSMALRALMDLPSIIINNKKRTPYCSQADNIRVIPFLKKQTNSRQLPHTKMKLLSLTAAMLLASTSTAFVVVSPTSTWSQYRQALPSTKLNDIDEMCIENVAELCLQADAALASECDLEEQEALVNQLQDQRDLLATHVERIENLLHRLKGDGLETPGPEQTYFPG